MMKLSANLRITNLVKIIYILHELFVLIFFFLKYYCYCIFIYIFFANAVTSSNILRAGVWEHGNA